MTKGTAAKARLLAASMNDLAPFFGRTPIEPPQPLTVTVFYPARLDSQVAEGRAHMGEDRWNTLQKEWPQ
jgi:hypothetical protein